MKDHIHFFSKSISIKKQEVLDKIGRRGILANEFAQLKLPILPGFIIDSEAAPMLDNVDLIPLLKTNLKKFESDTNKVYNRPDNPLLIKIVISPNLNLIQYPALHNFGLTEETIPGFNKFVGDNFGFHEVQFLIKGYWEIECKLAELEERNKDVTRIEKIMSDISAEMEKEFSETQREKLFAKYKKDLPEGFFSDAFTQLDITLKRISTMLALDDLNDNDVAILIQPMVYGNYGKGSASGSFFTRDIVTGEKKLQGFFYEEKFDSIGDEGNDINKIGKVFHTELKNIANTVEDHFKEIRSIRFTIEKGKVWLIDQRPVMTKSTQADIQTLLDLNRRKIIDEKYMINAIKPVQLNEILHPIVDLNSTKTLKPIEGGISGAPGAAIGRIVFSTDGLLEAKKAAQQKGEDTRLILCMPATFAEDVKAIEASSGVLSNEGGYAAHASVVARQYGKVSLVKTDMKIQGKKAVIGSITLKEGDYITLNVPQFGDPVLYLGKAELIEPDPQKSGLLDFIEIIRKYIKSFHVRANADNPRDAALALKFGAEGIGLCRTEHMFFEDKRINVFREMIISDTEKSRREALKKLKNMQKADFYQLFKIMNGKEVTIRLLDAPLHEFLPHNQDEMNFFISYLNKQKGAKKYSKSEVQNICDSLTEFNPMLGHRGCRIAVSYPEIYEMQVEAIFESVYKLKKEGIKVFPEIMIPLIMNENELKLLIYGKKIEGKSYKGILQVEKDIRKTLKAKPVDFKIGTMVELPAAALGAGEIAKYAQFFSFGTNDLTQTTTGLSRDDFNSFMPDYTQFDLLSGNPFQMLSEPVKELVATAVRRGNMTRPDLIKGLCGEHGAIPENIKFCMGAGLNYVSCSSYSVPIANLAVAQINLEKEE